MQRVQMKGGRGGAPLQAVVVHRFKVISLILWAAATSTTFLFLNGVAEPATSVEMLWVAAIVVQTILTVLESDFIRGMRSEVSVFAVVLDTLINAAGLWPFVQNVDQSSVWVMLSELFGMYGGMSPYVAGLIALVGGYTLAIAPEKIWR